MSLIKKPAEILGKETIAFVLHSPHGGIRYHSSYLPELAPLSVWHCVHPAFPRWRREGAVRCRVLQPCGRTAEQALAKTYVGWVGIAPTSGPNLISDALSLHPPSLLRGVAGFDTSLVELPLLSPAAGTPSPVFPGCHPEPPLVCALVGRL